MTNSCLDGAIFDEKDADDDTDYLFNWAADLDGDTLESSVFLLPDGLTEISSSFDLTTATIFVRGGSCGSTYRITNRVTTLGGRKWDDTIRIRVKDQ